MALTVPVAEIVESSKNPLLGKHESWGRVLLGDIATIQNGFPFKSSQFTRDEGMPLIRIRDVGADNSETYYVGDYDPAFVVQAGDLLIGMDGDFNCARWRGPKGLLNQRVCRVILTSDVYHPRLLDYALPGYLKAINDMTSSVTVKHLSSKSIAEIPLPLPPMDQQNHIVAEIEKQFSRLDEAVANLKRVKANLKRYKATVLKAAVEGRLVETEAELARHEGRNYETGAQLLQRILETRRSQWKGKGKYKEPAEPDTTGLHELPEGWVWVSWEMVLESTEGAFKRGPFGSALTKAIFVEKGFKVYEQYCPINDDCSFVRYYITPEKFEELRAFEVQAGDYLISCSGVTLGRITRVPEKFERGIINQALLRVRINEAFINDQYFLHLFRSALFQKSIFDNSSGSAIPNVKGVKELKAMAIPLPNLAEQKRIVAEVDRRLSLVREVKSQVDSNLQRGERLRQSILMRSFSGLLPFTAQGHGVEVQIHENVHT